MGAGNRIIIIQVGMMFTEVENFCRLLSNNKFLAHPKPQQNSLETSTEAKRGREKYTNNNHK